MAAKVAVQARRLVVSALESEWGMRTDCVGRSASEMVKVAGLARADEPKVE